MIPQPLSTIQLPRLLHACIYAALLCAFFGVSDDNRSKSKSAVCAGLDMNPAGCARMADTSPIATVDLPLCGVLSSQQHLRIWTGDLQFSIDSCKMELYPLPNHVVVC